MVLSFPSAFPSVFSSSQAKGMEVAPEPRESGLPGVSEALMFVDITLPELHTQPSAL